jgi:uncharacterized membrane protein YdjX (TVP38/TMEM64 family)
MRTPAAALRICGLLLALAGGIAIAFWILRGTEWAMALGDADELRRRIDGLGRTGPLALIGLMALAIVVSPLPSAPIAMAAGAVYGHYWGTLYVVIGAELGAITAFAIARFTGGETLRRWFGDRLEVGLLGSQNHLTALVFALRLLPFVSFDVVSYAAGLTRLRFWRFSLATLAGVTPIAFLLSHFGDAFVGRELDRIGFAVLALGLLTAGSAYFGFRRRRKR